MRYYYRPFGVRVETERERKKRYKWLMPYISSPGISMMMIRINSINAAFVCNWDYNQFKYLINLEVISLFCHSMSKLLFKRQPTRLHFRLFHDAIVLDGWRYSADQEFYRLLRSRAVSRHYCLDNCSPSALTIAVSNCWIHPWSLINNEPLCDW